MMSETGTETDNIIRETENRVSELISGQSVNTKQIKKPTNKNPVDRP